MTPSDRLEAPTRNRWLEWLLGPEREPDASSASVGGYAGLCPGADFPRQCPNPQHPIGCGPRGYMQKRYFTDWRPQRTREWARSLIVLPSTDESATDHDAEPRAT